jgi:hypothetical protein
MADKIYKIRSFNEQLGSVIISIEGYPDLLNVDIPLDENNNLLIGDELHLYINGLCPHTWLQRQEKLKKPIGNIEVIKVLVEPWPENKEE